MQEQYIQPNIEQIRQNLAEKVKIDLEKYKDEIDAFGLMTTSKYKGMMVDTNAIFLQRMTEYHSDRDEDYEFKNFTTKNNYSSLKETGYMYNIRSKVAFLKGYLGRALHTPDRPGNGFYIKIKFKNDAKHDKELLESIFSLLNTLKPYEDGEVESDLKNILKEGIPILEAFEDFSNNLPDNKNSKDYYYSSSRLTVSEILKEYRELLASYEENKS